MLFVFIVSTQNPVVPNRLCQNSLDDPMIMDQTISFLNAVSDSSLIKNTTETHLLFDKSIKNFKKRLMVAKEDYTGALNILAEEYLNANNPVDSLFALMEIEIVTLLSETSEQKSNINYKIADLKPACFEVQHLNSKRYWNQIDRLLSKDSPSNLTNVPAKPVLISNYPNPFNPTTNISFSIPKTSRVEISVYNIKGQKVRTLLRESKERGFHNVIWNGIDENNKKVSSGVYFYKLLVDNKVISTKKCLMLK